MRRNVWTTPFGLALLIGSGFALILGYAYGRNVVSVPQTDYNSALGFENMSGPTDENLLIDANREPATSEPVRTRENEAPAPAVDTRVKEVEVPAVTLPETDAPDEADAPPANESGQN